MGERWEKRSPEKLVRSGYGSAGLSRKNWANATQVGLVLLPALGNFSL